MISIMSFSTNYEFYITFILWSFKDIFNYFIYLLRVSNQILFLKKCSVLPLPFSIKVRLYYMLFLNFRNYIGSVLLLYVELFCCLIDWWLWYLFFLYITNLLIQIYIALDFFVYFHITLKYLIWLAFRLQIRNL